MKSIRSFVEWGSYASFVYKNLIISSFVLFASNVTATEYKGTYTCGQGKTQLTLTIDKTDSDANAIFDFNHGDKGIYGSFKMHGTYDKKKQELKLVGGGWIRRPKNYDTVDLTGVFDSNENILTGTINTVGCSTFLVSRSTPASSIKTGQQEMVRTGCNIFTGFVNNKDGTVTDTRNGLIWKRCPEGTEFSNGTCAGKASEVLQKVAMSLAKESRYLGNSDWRLPTEAELRAVLTTDIKECPNRNQGASKALIPETKVAASFWSSSPAARPSYKDPEYFYFYDADFSTGQVAPGYASKENKSDYGQKIQFRLVRDGKLVALKASPEFVNEIFDERRRLKEIEDVRLEAKRKNDDAQRESQRKAEDIYKERVANFRRSIKEGDDTSSGLVVQVNGGLIKIQTNDSQCSQRDYKNNCINWINTPVEKWFKRTEIYPRD